ncbi:PhzF family phenazine biosynthesis protein [Pimelobacter simplex]|uniref:PhzF family phenazine biosynthesis protein n=1 Tax=Nocardioides simplex TaxID=2045 RepID=UPI00366C4681
MSTTTTAGHEGAFPLPYAVVDAGVAEGLAGNPAAVVRLDRELPDDRLLDLARALDEPVAAFVTRRDRPDSYGLRWFTRTAELRICGHATMAASEWLLGVEGVAPEVEWHSHAGVLRAVRVDGNVTVDLPQTVLVPADPATADRMAEALGQRPVDCYAAGDDLLAVLAAPADVITHIPDEPAIAGLRCRGLIVTAALPAAPPRPGGGYDIVSRFFAPSIAIPEDEVCVSAHCALYPFWSAALGKGELRAWQASPRGGALRLVSRQPGRVAATARCRLTRRGIWPPSDHG